MMLSQAENFLSSFDYIFVSQCIFSLFSLISGLFFGSVIRIFVPVKKKSARLSAFSAMCIFLTLMVLLYTAFIFIAHSLSPFPQFQKIISSQEISERFYYIFLSSIFVFGTLLFLFLKVLLPFSLFFYFTLSFFTNFLLEKSFGEQLPIIPVRVEKDAPSEIKIFSYDLSDLAIFPVRRHWYTMNENFVEEASPLLKNNVIKIYLHKFILTKKNETHVLTLPEEKIYPSLYSIRIDFKKGRHIYSLEKDL
jgi:hypothetical protein